MTIGRFYIEIGLYERYFNFGIMFGFLEDIPAYGLVINLGAGGIIIGYKVND